MKCRQRERNNEGRAAASKRASACEQLRHRSVVLQRSSAPATSLVVLVTLIILIVVVIVVVLLLRTVLLGCEAPQAGFARALQPHKAPQPRCAKRSVPSNPRRSAPCKQRRNERCCGCGRRQWRCRRRWHKLQRGEYSHHCRPGALKSGRSGQEWQWQQW